MTIDGCGISSPPLRAFKNFRAIIKIRADSVCWIHVSMVLSNQSVNQYHSFAVTRCQIFRLKCTKFFPSPRTSPPGVGLQRAGRRPPPSLSPRGPGVLRWPWVSTGVPEWTVIAIGRGLLERSSTFLLPLRKFDLLFGRDWRLLSSRVLIAPGLGSRLTVLTDAGGNVPSWRHETLAATAAKTLGFRPY